MAIIPNLGSDVDCTNPSQCSLDCFLVLKKAYPTRQIGLERVILPISSAFQIIVPTYSSSKDLDSVFVGSI